jgi:hypothetical protein
LPRVLQLLHLCVVARGDARPARLAQLERLRDKRLRQAKIEQVRRKRWEAKGRGGYGHIAESGLLPPLPCWCLPVHDVICNILEGSWKGRGVRERAQDATWEGSCIAGMASKGSEAKVQDA